MVLNPRSRSALPRTPGDPAGASYLTAVHNALLADAMTSLGAHIAQPESSCDRSHHAIHASRRQWTDDPRLEALFHRDLAASVPAGFPIRPVSSSIREHAPTAPTFDVDSSFCSGHRASDNAAHRVLGEYPLSLGRQ